MIEEELINNIQLLIKEIQTRGDVSIQEKKALLILHRALEMGCLTRGNLSKVADFGSGFGDSLKALKRVTDDNNIVALEIDPERRQMIIDRGILPEEQVIKDDGVEFLKKVGIEDKKNRFSLVTAFALGPDKKGILFKRLVEVCADALGLGGKLLVSSDSYTMSGALDACKNAGLYPRIYTCCSNYHSFPDATFFILSQTDCSKFKK